MLKIKKLETAQWPIFKNLRLAALKNDPNSFGKTYAEESELSDEDWKKRSLESEDKDILIAYIDEIPVGLIFVFIRKESRQGALAGFWVHQDHRRKGIGKELVLSAINWLTSRGIKEVSFWNNIANEASSAFYKKMGFEYIGEKKALESNDSMVIQMMRKDLS